MHVLWAKKEVGMEWWKYTYPHPILPCPASLSSMVWVQIPPIAMLRPNPLPFHSFLFFGSFSFILLSFFSLILWNNILKHFSHFLIVFTFSIFLIFFFYFWPFTFSPKIIPSKFTFWRFCSPTNINSVSVVLFLLVYRKVSPFYSFKISCFLPSFLLSFCCLLPPFPSKIICQLKKKIFVLPPTSILFL